LFNPQSILLCFSFFWHYQNSDDLMKFEGADRLKSPVKPLIVVPTTAGTGSEVTFVAVIKDKKKKVKMSFASHLLFPKVAIIDPRMTQTMPPFITAATGMDALTHAMEAYTCIQKNPISDAYAAIQLIATNLIKAVSDGKNVEAHGYGQCFHHGRNRFFKLHGGHGAFPWPCGRSVVQPGPRCGHVDFSTFRTGI
jgi:alcohol dehydrogenase class IV